MTMCFVCVLSLLALTPLWFCVAVFSFTPITKGCLNLLICRRLDHPEGASYLGIDMSVRCWQGEHETTVRMAVLVLLVVVLVLPGLFVLKVRKGKEHYYSAKGILAPSPLNPIYCSYKPQYYFWICFEILLKLMINIVALLGRFFDFQWQMLLQQILILAALAAFQFQPVSLPLRLGLLSCIWCLYMTLKAL